MIRHIYVKYLSLPTTPTHTSHRCLADSVCNNALLSTAPRPEYMHNCDFHLNISVYYSTHILLFNPEHLSVTPTSSDPIVFFVYVSCGTAKHIKDKR